MACSKRQGETGTYAGRQRGREAGRQRGREAARQREREREGDIDDIEIGS